MTIYTDPLTGRHLAATARVALRWFEMPYGSWTWSNGREVLFNRNYDPIWERIAPDAKWTQANRTERASDGARQAWFYSDADKTDVAKEAKALAALSERGLPSPDSSILVKVRAPSRSR